MSTFVCLNNSFCLDLFNDDYRILMKIIDIIMILYIECTLLVQILVVG